MSIGIGKEFLSKDMILYYTILETHIVSLDLYDIECNTLWTISSSLRLVIFVVLPCLNNFCGAYECMNVTSKDNYMISLKHRTNKTKLIESDVNHYKD